MSEFNGKLVADKYRVGDLVREGKASDLYFAKHEITGARLLMELVPKALAIDARVSEHFMKKARRLAGITHQNLLHISDFGTDSAGTAYVVYDEDPDRTLSDALDDAAIDQERALRIAVQIADGLQAAHFSGIAHGSLSPDTILLGRDELGRDTVKIYGMGADGPMESAAAASPYDAPERLRGEPASVSGDIYSLGVIMYEMLSGSRPFLGQDVSELLTAIAAGPPPLSTFRRDLHPAVEPIVMTSIAALPDERYSEAGLLAEDIRRILGTEKNAALTSERNNLWKAAAVSVAGIAILASGLIYATYTPRTDPTAELRPDPQSLPVQPIGPATGALEDDLARRMPMSEAEILTSSTADVLPGGDGYNPWANGGAPPPGAPLNSVLPPAAYMPPGQVYTIDPNSGSQFMPNESGVILVPVPANSIPALATPTPRGQLNANTQQTPPPAAANRSLMQPPQPKTSPTADPPARTAPSPAPPKPSDPELNGN